MPNLFSSAMIPTTDQQSVLMAEPNLIITGAAGTGKTLLTILLAEKLTIQSTDVKVVIIILTKSLKKYIEEALAERGVQKTKVYYQNEWNNEHYHGSLNTSAKYDYIIVDEVQDFSLNQIHRIRSFCSKGFYVLGDSNQKILDNNFGEQTASMEEIKRELLFPEIELMQNVRFNAGIKNFICDAFPKIRISETINKEHNKPIIFKCESKEKEIEKICDLLKNSDLNGRTGILVQINDDVRLMVRKFKEKGIELFGFKTNEEEKMLLNDTSTNILTYHSAKGMEFDNVILPFLSINEVHFKNPNIFYVAFSRTRIRLILLYTENFNYQIKLNNPNFYDGVIRRPQLIDAAKDLLSEYDILFKATVGKWKELGLAPDINVIRENLKAVKERHKAEAAEYLRDAGCSLSEMKVLLNNYEDD